MWLPPLRELWIRRDESDGRDRRAGVLETQSDSIGVRTNDRAVDADQQLVPDQVGDRVLDEPDAAVAHADVHSAGVQAPRLAADIVRPGLPTVVPWSQLQGMPSWPRLGNCAAKVQQVWVSSPPSSQLGGPGTMKFEFGPGL